MATSTHTMTFAEFERLPHSAEGRYELRHGELVPVPPAKQLHYRIQTRLLRLLQANAGPGWETGMEMPFRPKTDFEFWYADVGLISAERFNATDPHGNIQGAPELVVEVLSPSNTVSEMRDRSDICLRNGSREFWLVDPERRTVEVTTPDGHTIRYEAAGSVPVWFGAPIAVSAIFE